MKTSSETCKSRAAGSNSIRVKEYWLKDTSKEDSSVEIPQITANLKGSKLNSNTQQHSNKRDNKKEFYIYLYLHA